MSRMRLPLPLWALLCSAISCGMVRAQELPNPPQTPPQPPSSLSPSPRNLKELIRRGTQPLSAKMPDTKLRAGVRPADVSQEVFDLRETPSTVFRGDDWLPIQYNWVASDLRYRPLYFEDAMLERHGQTRHPLVQPVASGTRFFLTFPVLPYAMTVNSPRPAQARWDTIAPAAAPRYCCSVLHCKPMPGLWRPGPGWA